MCADNTWRYSPRILTSSACGAFDNFRMAVRRKTKDVPIMLCVVLLTSLFHIGGSVWSGPAGHMPYKVYFFGVGVTPGAICSNLQGLSHRQMKYCRDSRYRSHIASVLSGANIAIEECQFQLRYQRWNCSLNAKDSANVFGRVTEKATRQSAFTYAMSSAGVTWAVSRACADGNLSDCSCSKDTRTRVQNRYTRCGDNTAYGKRFSTMFMDASEHIRKNNSPQDKARTLMNIHNNNVGRELVNVMSKVTCRCHGPTSNCNIKTCWRQLPYFREIGDTLFVKYRRAVHVKLNRGHNRLVVRSRQKRYKKDGSRSSQPLSGDLIYLDSSPNYCVRDVENNILGTSGRRCSVNSREEGGCNSLCCGRGYQSTTQRVQQRCKCKFYWCCYVKCKQCSDNVVIHKCL